MAAPSWFVAALFVATLFVASLAAGCDEPVAEANVVEAGAAGATTTSPAETTKKTVAVRTTPAVKRAFESRVTLKAEVQARNFSFVGAKIPGVLEEVFVDVGDTVVADETVLFRTDRAKLEKAVEAQKATLALAKAGVREKQAMLALLNVALDKAKTDNDRHERLHASETVSDDQWERVQTGYRQARASARHGKVLVDLAREQKRQAEVGLAIAEKDLADTSVKAPISGVVSQRRLEPGETAAPGMPFIQITDTSALRVSALVPAGHYGQVVPGTTLMRVRVGDIDLGALTIAYRAPVIDHKTRTFEVRATLPSGRDDVAAGGLADVDLLLTQREGVGVPESSVVARGGEAVVFLAEDGVARRKIVSPGIETDGWVELRDAPFPAGAAVVTDGQTLVDDGTPVKVLGEGN